MQSKVIKGVDDEDGDSVDDEDDDGVQWSDQGETCKGFWIQHCRYLEPSSPAFITIMRVVMMSMMVIIIIIVIIFSIMMLMKIMLMMMMMIIIIMKTIKMMMMMMMLVTPWALFTRPLCLGHTVLHPYLSNNQTIKQSNIQTVKQSNNHISQLTCRRRSSNWLHCYNILSFLGYFGLGWNFAPAQPNSKDKQDGDQEHGHLSIWKCFSRLTCLDSAFARRIHFLPKTSLSIRAFPLQWIPMRANQCWVTEGERVGKWGVR